MMNGFLNGTWKRPKAGDKILHQKDVHSGGRVPGWQSRPCLFYLLLLGFLAAPSALADQAQEPPFAISPTIVGEFGGETTAVVVGPEAVYAAVGARIRVLERGAQPGILGESPIVAGRVSDLLVDGQTLYVAAGSAGVIAMDVTDSTDITVLWSVAPPAAGHRFVELALLEGGLLATRIEDLWGSRLRLIDAAAPARQFFAGDINFPESVRGIDGLGDALLVRLLGQSGRSGIRLLEIDAVSGAVWERGFLGGVFSAMAVHGNQVFAAAPDQLMQIDWSEATSPEVVHRWASGLRAVTGLEAAPGQLCATGEVSIGSPGLQCFALEGAQAPRPILSVEAEDGQGRFLPSPPDGPGRLALDEQGVYLAWSADGLQRFEAAPMDSGPQIISAFETKPSDLALQGDLAFTTSIWTGLEIWDISRPNDARRLWAEEELRSLDLAVDGPRLYSVLAGEIEIRDISNPEAPVLLGQTENIYSGGQMQARDGRLYFLQTSSTSGGPAHTLLIIDPQNPQAPRELLQLGLGRKVSSYAIQGDRLWYANSTYEVAEVDLSDLAHPRELARHRLPFTSAKLAAAGDRLVARDAGEVQVYDIATVGRLKPIGDPIPAWNDRDMTVDGRLMALTGSLMGLRLFDISGAGRPVELARWAPDSSRSQQSARLVSIDGDRLIAGFGTGTSQTMNTLDVSRPEQVAHERMLAAHWDLATDLQSHAGRGFLASGWSGDGILDLRDRARPAIEAWLSEGKERQGPRAGSAPPRRIQTSGSELVLTSPFSAYALDQPLPALPSFDYRPDPGPVLVSGIVVRPQTLVEGQLGFVGWHPVFRGGAGGTAEAGPVMLDILDLGVPNPPQRLGRMELGDSPVDMARSDSGYLYVAGLALLHVLDTRDPQSPTRVGAVSGAFHALAIRGQRLWALRSQALEAFDLSDPAMPRYLGSIALPRALPEGYEGRLAVSQHGLRRYAAVPMGEAGLLVLDLTQDQPEVIGMWSPGWPVAAVSLEGRQATVALDHGGLLTVDLEVEAGLIAERLYFPAVWR
jgi:hypothetical protein